MGRFVVVTGTDTEVGKTAVTAAMAAVASGRGERVAAYKPTQTGVGPGEPGDMAVVERLAGVPTVEGVRLRAPMAPRPAAALEHATLPTLAAHVATAQRLAAGHDLVLVEGAGGLLVELTEARETLADLAAALPDAGVVVVARSALGTLNHTILTLEALACRGLRTIGVVIGAWPQEPGVVEVSNREHLAGLPHRLLGALPLGAPHLPPEAFRAAAPGWLRGAARAATGLTPA
jgi:dethiobiotin synthetase